MYARSLLLISILVSTVILAQAPVSSAECLSIDDLSRIRIADAPVVSPDGAWIAFRVIEPPDTAQGEKRANGDIWLADFEGKREARPFAFGPASESTPRWSPDGEWIAFLADRGKRGVMQVYRIRRAGGEAERVTDLAGGVRSFEWSPDGKRLAVLAPDPLPETERAAREHGYDEIVVGREERCARLRLVDAATGEEEALTPVDIHILAASWSPDGSKIAAIVSDRPGMDAVMWHARLEVVTVDGGSRTELAGPAQGVPDWSSDGSDIAFAYLVSHPEVSVAVPVVAVIGANGGNLRVLGKGYPGSLGGPRWLGDEDKLVVFERYGVRGRLAYLSVEKDEVEPFTELLVPYYGDDAFSISKDGKRIASLRGDAGSPPDLWSIDRGWFGDDRKLTDLNPWIAGRDLPGMKVVRWKSRDGTEIEGLLVLPPGYRAGELYPAVLNIHGGPMWAWWLGWHGSWHEWALPLACRGFVVLLPNPRGSAGYGVGFARANFDDWGGGDFEDIVAGADFLESEGYADPDRICIGGWSYGGYMSAWAVTQTDRFRAAVVGAAVTNLVSFHGTTDITPTFLSMYFRDTAYRRSEAYRSHSAINFVQRAKTPTLILHGEKDGRVPVGQAYEFYRGLVQSGVEAELVIYPREGHALREIYHRTDLMHRIVDWFELHCRE